MLSFWSYAWRWWVVLAGGMGVGLAVYYMPEEAEAVLAIVGLATLICVVLFVVPLVLYWMARNR